MLNYSFIFLTSPGRAEASGLSQVVRNDQFLCVCGPTNATADILDQ